VLAAILAIGPVTVAASMFTAAARRTLADPGDERAQATVGTLHRICRVYALVAIAVPVFGLATGASLGVLTDPWLTTSIALTVLAAGVLGLLVLPGQREILGSGGGIPASRAIGRLAAFTGVFNLLWATVTVLMIVRPGSTTGA